MLFKKYREYYLAERNFMLTSSALVIYFVFVQFLGALGKLCDVEDNIQAGRKERDSKITERTTDSTSRSSAAAR